jgi:hypothetical protein
MSAALAAEFAYCNSPTDFSGIHFSRSAREIDQMSPLTLFGLFAVTAMLVCYAFESRNRWFILGFAVSCLLGSAYGFLQGAWPFGLVEVVWSVVALHRWSRGRLTD